MEAPGRLFHRQDANRIDVIMDNYQQLWLLQIFFEVR